MPFIIPGKNIKIRSVSGKDVSMGDIIVFKNGKSLTMHRMLARIPFASFAFLYQKGDASQFGNWIRHERVVGIVIAIQDETGTYIDISCPAAKKKRKKKRYGR